MASRELKFLSYAFAHRHESKSQILQDLWVSFELGGLRNGYFVEFGATDGLTNSNTYLLETKYDWKGILAEPNPVWHAELRANRSSDIEHRCVSSGSGRTVQFLTTDASDPELSGIAEFAHGDHFSAVRAQGIARQIETISLNDLLRQHGAPASIDYLSIDTEGSEYDILAHFDFSVRSRLISVEQNRKTEQPIEALLTSHGYVRVFPEFSQWDGWYVSRELLARGRG
jgi:FkbM family methyltransferase